MYTQYIYLTKTTTGTPIYVGQVVELPGCIAQWWTVDECMVLLNLAQIDYLDHLREHGLPIPRPIMMTNRFEYPLSIRVG